MNIMNLSFSFGDGMQVAAVALCGRSWRRQTGCGEDVRNHLPADRKYDLHCLGGTVFDMRRAAVPSVFRGTGDHRHGVDIARVLTIIVLLQIAQVIYMGCLRGAGDVIFTTIASTLSITFIRPIFSTCFAMPAGWD